ncbi:hypothetical protein LC607_20970 [Nostoc sp. CHAB 5824]|nr:hypothetical protein [Nostoc sp. CHAB 5824]
MHGNSIAAFPLTPYPLPHFCKKSNDYVEQLTYLLLLKMVKEQNQLPPPLGKRSTIPTEYSWEALRSLDGDAFSQFRYFLAEG